MYCAVTTMSPRFTICPYVLAYDFKRQVLSISDRGKYLINTQG